MNLKLDYARRITPVAVISVLMLATSALCLRPSGEGDLLVYWLWLQCFRWLPSRFGYGFGSRGKFVRHHSIRRQVWLLWHGKNSWLRLGESSFSPPTTLGGAWTETVIYSFSGGDGQYPNGALIFDKVGNLYGATTFGGRAYGTIFELSHQPLQTQRGWRRRSATASIRRQFGV